MTVTDTWTEAIRLADALMYDNGMLHPHPPGSEASMRWPYGVLAPASGGDGSDASPSLMRTEVICESETGATLRVCLRFLHLSAAADAGPGWERAAQREIEAELPIAHLLATIAGVPFELSGGERSGSTPHVPVTGLITASAAELPAGRHAVRLRVCVSNTTASREGDSLPASFIGAHMVLGLSGGGFVSVLDPPEWARAASAELVNERAWPVLAGDPERRDTMLSAPLVMRDYPVRPERTGGHAGEAACRTVGRPEIRSSMGSQPR